MERHHYVPILKAKAGEFDALRDLDHEVKYQLVPLFELVLLKDGEQLGVVLDSLSKKLARVWGVSRPLYLDVAPLGENVAASGLREADGRCRERGTRIIPVTGLSRSAEFQQSVRSVLQQDRDLGICLRLVPSDYEDPDGLQDRVSEVLDQIGARAAAVDLIVDMGELGGAALLTAESMLSAVPEVENWRSLTLAGTGFPQSLGRIETESVGRVARSEWRVWTALRRRSLPRMPRFGDYAIQHPSLPEIEGRILGRVMTVGIRYTAEEEWIILRGGRVMAKTWNQARELCQALVAMPEYKGPEFSLSDRYILDCANGSARTGNATTWRRMGTGHHLAMVVDQLASLYGS